MRKNSRQQRNVKGIQLIGRLASVLWLALASPGFAQEDEVIARGKQTYQEFCAVCHGGQGKGDGVMAEQLQHIRPADLTQLKKQQMGQFPFWRTYRRLMAVRRFGGTGHETCRYGATNSASLRGAIWMRSEGGSGS